MRHTVISSPSCPICGRDNSERPFLVIFFIVLLLSRNCFTVPPVLLLDRRAFLNNHLRINVNTYVYVSHSYPHTTESHCYPPVIRLNWDVLLSTTICTQLLLPGILTTTGSIYTILYVVLYYPSIITITTKPVVA